MKANTAIAFILSGLSLVLFQAEQRSRWLRFLTCAGALIACVLGLLNLSEYLFDRDFGIDQLLFTDPDTAPVPPGRMAITTALSFVMVGIALPLLVFPTKDQRRSYLVAQLLAVMVDMLVILSLMGYDFGVEALYSFGPYSAMALHTALTFALLGTGILFARPDHGLMVTFTSESAGGYMARRLLPAVIGVPFALGWLVLAGQRAGLYDPPFGLAIFTMSVVAVFAVIVFFTTRSLHKIDVQRLQAEQERTRLLGEVQEMAEDAQRRAIELAELDRLKDEFLTVAAHELKTPVTGIKGYAQILLRQDHVDGNPHEVKALQAINRQTDKISRLVNDLLQVTEFRAGHPELEPTEFDLSELVVSVAERVRRTAERHKLVLHPGGPVPVEADKDRIEQVLVNLLDNAMKYSPNGGEIELAARVDGAQAVVSIRDRGIGIPKDKQARIFERFYRAHTGTPHDYGGMGVGLYISNEIVRRHGGRMWFESEAGNGSTFYFILPAKGPSPERGLQ
ncbi:MAG: HAMP domain-containing histidine kinase [Chloroflexi bacterium]|nr:HAMP domain-containing histidine kinase [Chloroflexota bacterium]